MGYPLERKTDGMVMNLHLFDEGDGGADTPERTAGEGETPGAARAAHSHADGPHAGKSKPAERIRQVAEGSRGQRRAWENQGGGQKAKIHGQEGAPSRQVAFERLIKGDYKDLFEERVQRIIHERFKQTKALEERLEALGPVLSALGDRYGIGTEDTAALQKALEGEGYVSPRAEEEQSRESGRSVEMNGRFAEWARQAQGVQGMYPGFDLARELNDPGRGPAFFHLLMNHVPVRTAYEVLHKDELLAGAMEYTAHRIQKKTLDDIRARGMRPAENGAAGRAAAEVKADMRSLTRAERREIERRVARGEKVSF